MMNGPFVLAPHSWHLIRSGTSFVVPHSWPLSFVALFIRGHSLSRCPGLVQMPGTNGIALTRTSCWEERSRRLLDAQSAAIIDRSEFSSVQLSNVKSRSTVVVLS